MLDQRYLRFFMKIVSLICLVFCSNVLREVYIRRIQLSAETFLLEAEGRGKESQRLKKLSFYIFSKFVALNVLHFSHRLKGRFTAMLWVLAWESGR